MMHQSLPRNCRLYQLACSTMLLPRHCSMPHLSSILLKRSSSSTHYLSALHALKYLYSTSEYGILFHSNASSSSLQVFNHFLNHRDKGTYSDATPPAPSECHELTVFSNASGAAKWEIWLQMALL